MFSNRQRILALFSTSFLAVPVPAHAFETPLSDTAVREAYFLGQHHDEIYSDFLRNYVVTLPIPKTGPHIASVALFTPYALTAINSNQQAGTYSAQQAELDHDKGPEVVHVVIQIWLTASYGAYILQPADPHTTATNGFLPRSQEFWRDFRLRVTQGDQFVTPTSASGEPHFSCGDDSGCDLSGATITFEYPASVFSESAATVLVTPPEGDPISVDFDLASLR